MAFSDPTPGRSAYLDAAQRRTIAAERARPLWRGEWPTWLLIAVIHGGWFGTLACWDRIGPVLGTPLMIWWTAWYMSLQHELIHGHPTRRPWLNALFGTLPLAVWYPYGLYRDSHLRHHDDAQLTMPERDTESWYVSPAAWGDMGPLRRRLHWFNKTFIGRLLVGPALAVSATWIDAARRLLAGDWRDVPMWLAHFALLAGLLWWMQARCGVDAPYFLIAVSYPAQSLAMVRSFYEHRPAARDKERIVLNEADPLFRLLFLNNNLHLVHHDLPSLPWYLLPRVYRARRAEYLARNGHFYFDGYGDLARRHGWRAIDAPVHPHVPEVS